MNKELNLSDFREGNRIEAKLAKGGLPASIWETYSAFANTDGGLILLGVKEKKDHSFEFVGVENPDTLIKSFWDTVNNQTKVSVNLLLNKHVYTKEIEGETVIFIEVPRAERQFRPVYINKDVFSGAYHRNGEGDYRCTKEEVLEMFRDASPTSVDTKILTDMDESVFCTETVRGYRNVFRNTHINHVWDSLDDIDFLRKIGAVGLSTETGKLHPTAAGLLMFGYEYEIVREFPLYFLDYQEKYDDTIRWTDRIVSSSGDWSGNIFDFFFRIASKLTADIKRPFKLEGFFRVDDTAVHKAVREALVNTLVNADYYVRQGLVVQKYHDKLVFANPGSFRISLRDAFDGGISDPRNATILKMFAMLDIGERAGSGIPGIVAAWEENFKMAPKYILTSDPSRVKTVLDIAEFVEESNDKVAINADSIEKNIEQSSGKVAINDKSSKKITSKELILNYVATFGSIDSSKAVNLTGLSAPGVRKIFSQLVTEGKLISHGANKNRRYIMNTTTLSFSRATATVQVWNPNDPKNEAISEKIIELIKNDPNIPAATIAEKTGIDVFVIQHVIEKMEGENKIRRIGPDKGGHWEIITEAKDD